MTDSPIYRVYMDEIERLRKLVHDAYAEGFTEGVRDHCDAIEATAREARKAEREACAQAAQKAIEKQNKFCDPHFACDAEEVVAAIRARSKEGGEG